MKRAHGQRPCALVSETVRAYFQNTLRTNGLGREPREQQIHMMNLGRALLSLQTVIKKRLKSGREDLNLRPHGPEWCAPGIFEPTQTLWALAVTSPPFDAVDFRDFSFLSGFRGVCGPFATVAAKLLPRHEPFCAILLCAIEVAS